MWSLEEDEVDEYDGEGELGGAQTEQTGHVGPVDMGVDGVSIGEVRSELLVQLSA